MKGPASFVAHLTEHHYHPRSDAHSNAVCRGILLDLLENCPAFAAKAAAGEVVARLNHKVTTGLQDWNLDMAIGPPPGRPIPPSDGALIVMATPTVVEIAVEVKGVMTEHGKARHNRLRDLHSFHAHVHAYNPKAIAVGVVVVNLSEVFFSPTRTAGTITPHKHMDRLGAETIGLYRNLPLRNTYTNGPGLEAVTVIVVKHDNLNHPHLLKLPEDAFPRPSAHPPCLVEKSPAPLVGDPLHYATMIHRICTAYRERWAG